MTIENLEIFHLDHPHPALPRRGGGGIGGLPDGHYLFSEEGIPRGRRPIFYFIRIKTIFKKNFARRKFLPIASSIIPKFALTLPLSPEIGGEGGVRGRGVRGNFPLTIGTPFGSVFEYRLIPFRRGFKP